MSLHNSYRYLNQDYYIQNVLPSVSEETIISWRESVKFDQLGWPCTHLR